MEKKGFDWSSTQPAIEKAGPKFVSSNTLEVQEKKPWYRSVLRGFVVAALWIGTTLACFYMWKVIFDFLGW